MPQNQRGAFDPFLKAWSMVLALTSLSFTGSGQTLGVAKAPADLLRATILIETAETRTNTKYTPVGVRVRGDNDKEIQISPTNWVAPTEQIETVFHGAGSGVLITRSNVNFLATAKHVANPNVDLFFRIPQKNGGSPDHRLQRLIKEQVGIGWIYSTNSDLAITVIEIHSETDDAKFCPVDFSVATYESVQPGDDIFVSGFPSSVIELDAPALRSGIISCKLADKMILIDTLTFPGNSGGPVFWKPSVGIDLFGNKLGEPRPPSLIGLALYSSMFSEGAISPASGRTRIVFESNSGLTQVVSASRILELLDYPETKAVINRILKPDK